MTSTYELVRSTAHAKLSLIVQTAGGRALDPLQIRDAVDKAVSYLGAEQVDREAMVADLETIFTTRIGKPRVMHDDTHEPWLSKRKVDVPWRFWNRYDHYLRELGWAHATLDGLDASTDAVLDLLAAPDRPGAWDRRGLVVGLVQSGKTSHYTGLICKAADAGFKLIVVLAGFHKSLRSQTQIRLEEGFLGYERGARRDGAQRQLGVGRFDPSPRADTITTRDDRGDFKKDVARHFGITPGGSPLLFVVKKNGSVLKNLLSWVESVTTSSDDRGKPYVRGVPLLVIDDEADQGSIDTTDGAFDENGAPDAEHDPTVLNKRIRRLLHLFEKTAYVGYTATPFANIFIHEGARTENEGEDLFPRSFIVSLPAPSDYVGAANVFGYEDDEGNVHRGLPIVHEVDDHADSADPKELAGWMPPHHNKHHVPLFDGRDALPCSLSEAIRAFLLVCAARIARRQDAEHNSMLIHVTRFTAVQALVAEQVRNELAALKRRLRYGDGAAPSQLIMELKELWERDFVPTTKSITEATGANLVHAWPQIHQLLERALASLQVREINGSAGEVLDYVLHAKSGLNVIAIGGDKLSRGLTLEGLSVSYFLRASRMYDTLMQMGRWFGFRPGYLDLCRLYTTHELNDWFYHIAGASEELRADFNRMAASGATPRDFGHRVLSHPMMLVTSQVKMRHGTRIAITFQGDICETINFWLSPSRRQQNWQAAKRLIAQAAATASRHDRPPTGRQGWLWAGVEPQAILDFLAEYQVHPLSRKVITKLLADYIRAELKHGRLATWTVFLASGGSRRTMIEIGGVTTRLVKRSWHLSTTDDAAERLRYTRQGRFRIRRLVSPRDEHVDLSHSEVSEAMRRTLEAWNEEPGTHQRPTIPGGPQVRQVRDSRRGLLLLYPLDAAEAGEQSVDADGNTMPIVGFALSFPSVSSDIASRVSYVVNNVYYEQEVNPSHEAEPT